MALSFKPWKSLRHAAFVVAFVAAVVAVFSGAALVRDTGSADAHVAAGTIQVHKYLPKDPPNASAPWQNQGVGQGAWTYTVYPSLADAQAGSNAIATFDELGKNSPSLPLTELWVKETGMPAGQDFFGWFVPDGDGDSGNDKCNQQPFDGSTMDRSAILHIPAEYWATKGNRTGLFHICAYNAPRTVRTVKVCKVVVGNGDGLAAGPFAYGFELRPSASTAVSGSNAAAEPAPDTEGTTGAESCTAIEVPNDQAFDVVETPGRPSGWADAAGYPRYSLNGGAQVEGATTALVPAGPAAVTVTFLNKAAVTRRDITIIKTFANLGGYVPAAGDVPAFTLAPAEGTSCELPVKTGPSTWSVTCTVPYLWAGTVGETPQPGWRECTAPAAMVAAPPSEFRFCNEPYGTVRIEKFDGVSGAAGQAWDFTVSGNFAAPGGVAYPNPVQASHGAPFVSGPIALGATPVAVAELLARDASSCATENTYYTVVSPPADAVIDTPGEVQTWTFQNVPCGSLGTGGLIIEKHLDINGDGDSGDAGEGPLEAWEFTTSGNGIPAANQVRLTNASGQVADYASGIDAGTVVVVAESVRPGYGITRVTLDGAAIGTNPASAVVIIGGQTRLVRYYNQPRGSLFVRKETYNVLDGVSTRNLEDDDGWTVRVTSAACAVDVTARTGSEGAATFAGLPLCTDYVIAEDLALPGAPGYLPVTPATVDGVTPALTAGTEVVFVNETRENTPPRPPQVPTIEPTPTPVARIVPTATPTVLPTNTPRPSGTVFGERTPGPAAPTPIVPRTGGGAVGPVSGTANLVFLLGAAMGLCAGATIVGVKHRH